MSKKGSVMSIFSQHMIIRVRGLLALFIFSVLASCGQGSSGGAASSAASPIAANPAEINSAEGMVHTDQAKTIAGARILVFTKTVGWRHDSIPAGVAALEKLAGEHQFTVIATEDAALFTDADLSQFNAIVFLNTTLNVLDEHQEL